MKGCLLLLGSLVCLLANLPSVIGQEDEEETSYEQLKEEWNQRIDEYNRTFPNNDELKFVLVLTNDDLQEDFKKALEPLKGSYDFDKFLESLKTKYPSISAQLQPLYEKKLAAYRSLGEVERKLLDTLFTVMTKNLFDFHRTDIEDLTLQGEDARKWKKAFGALTDQQKDSIRSKFPLFTYFVRFTGKLEDVEGEKTESELSGLIDEIANGTLLDEIVKETGNKLDYQKMLDALKAKNSVMYEKVKPLAEKLHKAYEALPKEPKALMLQIFEWIFENRKAFKEETYDNYIAEDQYKKLKKRYYALPKDQQKLLESSFPRIFREIKESFELLIAKSFNKNR